ncbi:MAG: FixH family protein [Alphaproteobacteria bacterium]|nr:FixH family protein [Alphaproteobacteria bacterium]
MDSRILAVLAVAAAGCLSAVADAGERKAARVECTPVEQQALVYDCMFALKGRKSGSPIAGAEFTVGAEMPSMPGAHNILPVTAEPHGKPGMYRARITLDMTGEWALKLDFTRPDRDRLVEKLHFGGTQKGGGHRH